MAWFDRFKRVKSLQDFQPAQPGTVAGRWYVVDPGIPLSSDASPWQIFSTQPSVRKVVQFIARNTARIPLRVFTDGPDVQEVTTGPMFELVNHPRPYVGPYRVMYDLICDLLIYDRFAAMVLPSATAPSKFQLYRLPAYTWQFTWSGFEDVTGIQVNTAGGSSSPFTLDGVFWDHGYGGANGVSPMHTLSQTLQEYAESVKWRRAIWKNGARIPGFFAMDAATSPLSEEAEKRLEADLGNYLDGGGNEGRAPILHGISWETAQAFSPKDAQEVEGRTLADIEVASAYAVPPEMVGARQATYASTQAFRDALYQETLGPLFVQLEQQFNAQVVPVVQPGVHVKFDMQSALRGSFLDQATVLSEAAGGPWMSVNEARRENSMPVLGHEYDDIITPLNVTRGGGDQANPHDSGSQNVGGTNA